MTDEFETEYTTTLTDNEYKTKTSDSTKSSLSTSHSASKLFQVLIDTQM